MNFFENFIEVAAYRGIFDRFTLLNYLKHLDTIAF